MQITSKTAKNTWFLAAKLAGELVSQKSRKQALVVTLKGNLGAGKTTFAQGFIKSLLPKARVKSPTFLLMKHYPYKGRDIYHLDCYRVKSPKDLAALEIKKILSNPNNIVLIEWSERITRILPKKKISITMSHGKEEGDRIINISGFNA